jgi:hypothetical protein
MRISIAHTLGKDELRRRLEARRHEATMKTSALIGGLASVEQHWRDADTLVMDVSAMGFTVPCAATIEETALVFEVTMPPGLGFARGMIEGIIREKSEKLLA